MALFKRKHRDQSALGVLPPPARWSDRLALLGDAIDGAGQDILDLSIVLEGGPEGGNAMLSLLGHRQSTFHSGWTPLMFRLDPEADELTNYATGFSEAAYQPNAPLLAQAGPWQARLHAIGCLIDDRHPDLRSPTLIFLPGGVVINGIDINVFAQRNGSLVSFELSNDEIRAAAAATSAPPAQITRQR